MQSRSKSRLLLSHQPAHFEKVDIPKLNSVPLVISTAATRLSKQLIKKSNPPSNKLPVLSQMFLSNPMDGAVWI